jgi:uncharacterized protein (TIGR02145 family)
MGECRVMCEVYSSTILDITIGDYIVHNSENYYINRIPDIEKIDDSTYKYVIAFESDLYNLSKKRFVSSDGLITFSLSNDPVGFLNLIVDNINEINAGWTVGDYGTAEERTLSFSRESCRAALAKVAKAFLMEFDVSAKVISLKKNIGINKGYRFRYGRDAGLYKIVRQQAQDQNIVTKVYGYGGTTNIPFTYRSDAKRLVFESKFLTKNTATYGIIEGDFTDDEIYPKRTGTITGININFDLNGVGFNPDTSYVVDSSINFNLNSYFIADSAQKAKIVFKSGDLSGIEYEITRYDNDTYRIYFNPFTDAGGYTTPRYLDVGSFVRPEVGDTYTLINMSMPEAYVVAAEAALQVATQTYLDQNSIPQFLYSVEIDPKYAKSISLVLNTGDRVTVIDSAMGINSLIRVSGLEYPLVNPYKIKTLISDFAVYSFQERVIRTAIETAQETAFVEMRSIERDRARGLKMLQVAGNYLIKTGDIGVGNYDFIDTTIRITGRSSVTLTGIIDPDGTTTVTGVGTLFTSELMPGDRIKVSGETRTITVIISDTELIVDEAFSDGSKDYYPVRLPAIYIIKDSSNVIKVLVRDSGDVVFKETLSARLPNVITDYPVYYNPVTGLLTYGSIVVPPIIKKVVLYNYYAIAGIIGNRYIYGGLYNWFAASKNGGTGVGSIAPIDCHVPSNTEFDTLVAYLGGINIAGGKLKEAGLTHWVSPNTGADNSSGFTALGSGVRAGGGVFGQINALAYFWGITEVNSNNGTLLYLYTNSSDSLSGGGAKEYGYSIRCLKNSTTLTNGQTGTVTDVDGNVCPTICIGMQEWMAENLRVTRFNDGVSVPLVTGNAAWAALTTPGICYYDNL